MAPFEARPGQFGAGNISAAEAGRRGVAERERRRMERLSETRQALEADAGEARETLHDLLRARSEHVRYLAAKEILDRALGQSTQKVETIRLDAFEEAFRELLAADGSPG